MTTTCTATLFASAAAPDPVDGRVDDRADVDEVDVQPQLTGDDPAHVQQIVDDLILRHGVAHDRVDSPGDFGRVQQAALQHARPSEDSGQRRAELMADRREKLVLEPGRLFRAVARDPQVFGQAARPLLVLFRRPARLLGARQRDPLLLVPFPLRQIARDLREPDQSPVVIANGGDHHVGPETRAVLPDAPALVFEPAVARRSFQLPLALARPDILLGIEAREVLADDLVGGVALEPLGARVPRRHVAGRVENEDGVVLHRRDQQPEPLFASSQILVGSLVVRVRSRVTLPKPTRRPCRRGRP